MVITPLVISILVYLRRYKFVKRAQIQRAFFLRDKDGSVTRETLRKMKSAGLVKCLRPAENSSAPVVYVPTDAGCSILAAHTGDMKHLLDCEPNTRAWVNFQHYLCVTDLFITLDAAIADQSFLQMPTLFFEHDICNPEVTDPKKRYRLYTQVSDKVVCVPDAASEIRIPGFCRAYYWELERGTDSPARVAAKKSPGYAGLIKEKKFKLHFPDAADCFVIYVCPNPAWRDTLRRAMKEKPASEVYRFCSVTELAKDSILHAPVFYTVKDEPPKPFVKAPAAPPGSTPSPEACKEMERGQANVL